MLQSLDQGWVWAITTPVKPQIKKTCVIFAWVKENLCGEGIADKFTQSGKPATSCQFTPAQLVFNANLQDFAQRAGIIASLETAGKLSPREAYSKIELLWNQLTSSIQELGIDTDTAA